MTRIPSTVVITGNGLHGMAGTSLTLHVPSEGLPRIESMLLVPTSVNVSEHSSHTPAETGISGPQVIGAYLDHAQNPSVMPTQSEAWLGTPKLVLARDGVQLFPRFTITELTNAQTWAHIEAVDEQCGVQLDIMISINEAGLILQHARLTNLIDNPLEVRSLLLSVPVPDSMTELQTCTGHHLRERHVERMPFTSGLHAKESWVGRTGFDSTTLLCAGTRDFSFERGRVMCAHVAWSGNTVHFAEKTPQCGSLLGGGEALYAGEVTLDNNETYTSPVLEVSLGNGLNEASARFRETVRLAHKLGPRPVTLNTWEAVYYGQNETTLLELADVAAQVGVERFVVDDGWFLGRRTDTAGLGDWQVDDAVWPNGLQALADHVHELGMEFGLWFEPEMINLDSELARSHPDWILSPDVTRLGLSGRDQYVLDMSRLDARNYIFNSLSAIIDDCGVDYIKWDHNRPVTEAVSLYSERPAVHVQTEAVYELIDALKQHYPKLEIESCASGGGRIDMAMLQRADRVWASDCTDPMERVDIQRGTSLIVPQEMMGTHISASPNHATLRQTTLMTRIAMAFFGHLGVEWNLLQVPQEDLKKLTEWISLYKQQRGWMHEGNLVHADIDDAAVRVDGIVSQDGAHALYRYTVVSSSNTYPNGAIRFPGLTAGHRYLVRPFGGANQYLHEMSPSTRTAQPWWLDEGMVFDAALLTQWGIRPPQLAPEHAVLIECLDIANPQKGATTSHT